MSDIYAPSLLRRILTYTAWTVIAVVTYVAWNAIAAWSQKFFGFRNGDGNGSHYLFFSGSGSDLAYLSVFWGALVFYRKNNCHRALCWRLGHYDQLDPLTGITHKLCWRHHPAVKQRALKLHHIEAIHGRYLEHRRRRAS